MTTILRRWGAPVVAVLLAILACAWIIKPALPEHGRPLTFTMLGAIEGDWSGLQGTDLRRGGRLKYRRNGSDLELLIQYVGTSGCSGLEVKSAEALTDRIHVTLWGGSQSDGPHYCTANIMFHKLMVNVHDAPNLPVTVTQDRWDDPGLPLWSTLSKDDPLADRNWESSQSFDVDGRPDGTVRVVRDKKTTVARFEVQGVPDRCFHLDVSDVQEIKGHVQVELSEWKDYNQACSGARVDRSHPDLARSTTVAIFNASALPFQVIFQNKAPGGAGRFGY